MNSRQDNDTRLQSTDNKVISVPRETMVYGSVSGVANDVVISEPKGNSLTARGNLLYFSCEYLTGVLFLLLSIVFVVVVPKGLSKPGDLVLMVNRTVKRTTDIISALIGLVLTSPLWIIIPLLIKLTSKGPVFYSQVRVGINRRKEARRFIQEAEVDENRKRERRRVDYCGTTFRLFKFRTMIIDAEKNSGPVWAEKNDPRITALGRFLRKTRIDEIPQFINVLRGDMSLIGPRPERPEFVEKLISQVESYERRLEVKPGITGLAQVSNGYDSSISSVVKKVQHDIDYIDRWSIWGDIKIVLRTVIVVFTGRGAN